MARQAAHDRLADVPMFQGLSKRQLREVAARMSEIDIEAGRTLTREGDVGREFFIIHDGEVEVSRDGHPVATRGPGQYVGEIALLDHRPRTATVTAKTDVRAEVLDRREFTRLLESSPEISSQILSTMAQRLAELEGDSI